jgi:hypothetical protein
MFYEMMIFSTSNVFVFFVISLLILGIFIVGILLWEKRLQRKTLFPAKTIESIYLDYLYKLKNYPSNPNFKLETIREVSKSFFKYKFNLNEDLGFSDLVDYFSKIKEKEFASFCSLMVEKIYSGEKITNDEIIFIINSFIKLIILSQRREKGVDVNEPLLLKLEKDFSEVDKFLSNPEYSSKLKKFGMVNLEEKETEFEKGTNSYYSSPTDISEPPKDFQNNKKGQIK